MTLSAGQRFGAYEIVAALGAGGMGEVFRARDPRLGREIAVKVLPEAVAQDPNRLARFEQEARAASALNHPNIVTVYGIGREGDTTFIAMELVDGKTVRELAAVGPLPLRRVLNIAAQVAEGLAKAHAAGIVHRDLKPENVMVSKDGFVKILDFGLAKLVESRFGGVSTMVTLTPPDTDPGTVIGTVAYMSPEQASGESVDFRSDQFSLGSMIYEMTTGRRAFQRKTAAETMSAIIRDEPEPVAKLRPELPLPLRWMLERCLAKDREERYASTRDLARDLASVRDHVSEISTGAEAMQAVAGNKKPRSLALVGLAGLALLSSGLLAGAGLNRLLAPEAVAPSFQRLTFRQGELSNARFAPDGETVVYGARLGAESTGTLLYRTHAGSPESEKFGFPGDILAISQSNELVILQPDRTLARVPISGGTPRAVVEQVPYGGADFSPDGKDLAIARLFDDKTRLEYPIGNVLVPDGVNTPRLSRDGVSIAFWEGQPGSFAVTVIDRLGKSKQALSQGWARFTGAPCWSADGREIWFTASQPGEPPALWSVDLSGKQRLLARVPGELELDDVSPQGRVLIAHHTTHYTVRLASAVDPTERNLAWLDASLVADLSSDGGNVLLNEQGEGSRSGAVIYLRATDKSPAVKLADGVARSLSPDARWVLMNDGSIGGNARRLLLLPTGPGQTRALDSGGLTDFTGGAWLPDGKSVVFSASRVDGVSRLYVQSVTDGTPRPIGPERTRLQSLSSPVSPDGKLVVGSRAGQVLLVSLDGAGDARVIPGLAAPPAERVAQWTSDSKALYVYQVSGQRLTVWLVDVKTGLRRPWKEFTGDFSGGRDFRVTPDGNTWVHSGRVSQSELYLVTGLR